jgi:hypothetical protein
MDSTGQDAPKPRRSTRRAAELAAPQPGRLPAGALRPEGTTWTGGGQQQSRPAAVSGSIKADTSAAALDATANPPIARGTARNTAAPTRLRVAQPDKHLDSPRRTADDLSHQGRRSGAARGSDAPTPGRVRSPIRLLHAVADGKRAIQMHLHPAELGSIDVEDAAVAQGDKLTAQFTRFDRPGDAADSCRAISRPRSSAAPRPGRRQAADSGSLSSLRLRQRSRASGKSTRARASRSGRGQRGPSATVAN